MEDKRSLKDKIFLFLKGLSMGAANKVPGVSGGTVAFVLGFYEELIYSFQKINLKAFALLFRGRFKSFWQYTNAQFLILVMGGSVFSYFTVSLALDFLLKRYETLVWSLFFGMILGSVYYVGKAFNNWTSKNILVALIGILIGVSISLMSPAKENDNLWFVFLCGMIGVSGMTLPGLSGSFILILLGNYVLLLVDSVNMLSRTFSELIVGDFSFLDNAIRVRYLKIIAVFTLGSTFGLVSISHVLGYVLKRWHDLVNALIIGFIVGSLGTVWPWKQAVYKEVNGEFLVDSKGTLIVENYKRFLPEINTYQTWLAIVCIILGFLILTWLDNYSKNNKRIDK